VVPFYVLPLLDPMPEKKFSPEVLQALRLRDSMYSQLAQHEGVKDTAYTDTTGNPTIGIGFNLNDPSNQKYMTEQGMDHRDIIANKRTLSQDQIKQLYRRSFRNAYDDSLAFLPDLGTHPEPVQKAVLDMAFNLGRPNLLAFKKTQALLKNRNYKSASKEMLRSKWASQVKGRAVTLSNMVAGAAPPPGTGNHPLNK
jgi:lysozyme